MGNDFIYNLFSEYGLIFVFLITILEYMNFPGIPGGLIYIVAGVWASQTTILNLFAALIVSVIAGVIGSVALYYFSKISGMVLIDRYFKKFPKYKEVYLKYVEKLRVNDKKTILVARLLPAVRTLIAIPAGIVGMDIKNYLIYSTFGILVWNFSWLITSYLGFDFIKMFL